MIALILVLLVVLLVIGVPVAFAIGMTSTAYLMLQGYPPINIVAQKMVDGINSFPLMALPLFILSGEIMSYGCTQRLMRLANLILGWIPGGLGAAGVAASAFFGAISGSGVATTAAIGGIVGPEMVDRGYGKGLTASLLSGAGSLGSLIPPSVIMVVYCSCTGVSVRKMFLGGYIPGILCALALIGLVVFLSAKRKYPVEKANYSFHEVVKIFCDALLPLMMPLIILGGVMGGIFTPTESAVVAVVYSLIITCFVYRNLKISDLVNIGAKCAVSTAVILFIMSNAAPFGWILATQNVPTIVANGILGLTQNPVIIFGLIAVLLLFLGTFMETTSIIILLTPMLYPVAIELGLDPVHFGIFMILNLCIGASTPPLAVCLFTSTKILGIQIEDTFPEVLYVCGILTVVMIFLMIFPQIVMFLPNAVG